MKEVVVISGKGGTGKTSVTAAFSILWGMDTVVADCDVDASDLHILLQPEVSKTEEFFSGILASIDHKNCSGCGLCEEKCRFQAISHLNGEFMVDPIRCEGCGYCIEVCPESAIEGLERMVGHWHSGTTRHGSPMIYAALKPGAENSGKLVAKVKQEARTSAENHGKELVLIDGSPGLGCPVVSSLSGAHFVVYVTEPSLSGFHDLKRIASLVQRFRIPSACIINRSDINPGISAEISEYLLENSIIKLGEVPYSKDFTRAMRNGKTIVEEDSLSAEIITNSWKRLKTILSRL